MVETDKMVGNTISSRTIPKIVKMWNTSGVLKKVSATSQIKTKSEKIKKLKKEIESLQDSEERHSKLIYKSYEKIGISSNPRIDDIHQRNIEKLQDVQMNIIGEIKEKQKEINKLE